MVIVVMGVAASGKTTVGHLLAEELGWTFYDADDFHPDSNVEKMSRGVPLDDEDRRPWLETLGELIRECLSLGRDAVLACSALKESYRERLLIDERVRVAYLEADRELIGERLNERTDHFMKADMLDSQFAALQEPEESTHYDASRPPAELVREIRGRLGV
ncbi:MAG TPA: gluconokinase [Pyrinomonadaceae bacterium]|jgi:gluconokinase|nr:gluconokinase [Pyrinomonadaceae bacterium]